jgi:hypothetical protein
VVCEKEGATIRCSERSCNKTYHFGCAHTVAKCLIVNNFSNPPSNNNANRTASTGRQRLFSLQCAGHATVTASVEEQKQPPPEPTPQQAVVVEEEEPPSIETEKEEAIKEEGRAVEKEKMRHSLLINLDDELYTKKKYHKLTFLVPQDKETSNDRQTEEEDESAPFIVVGSLQVRSLGSLETISDYRTHLAPTNYKATRLFWSTKQLDKKCVYTCRIRHMDAYRHELRTKSNLIDQMQQQYSNISGDQLLTETEVAKQQDAVSVELCPLSQLDGHDDTSSSASSSSTASISAVQAGLVQPDFRLLQQQPVYNFQQPSSLSTFPLPQSMQNRSMPPMPPSTTSFASSSSSSSSASSSSSSSSSSSTSSGVFNIIQRPAPGVVMKAAAPSAKAAKSKSSNSSADRPADQPPAKHVSTKKPQAKLRDYFNDLDNANQAAATSATTSNSFLLGGGKTTEAALAATASCVPSLKAIKKELRGMMLLSNSQQKKKQQQQLSVDSADDTLTSGATKGDELDAILLNEKQQLKMKKKLLKAALKLQQQSKKSSKQLEVETTSGGETADNTTKEQESARLQQQQQEQRMLKKLKKAQQLELKQSAAATVVVAKKTTTTAAKKPLSAAALKKIERMQRKLNKLNKLNKENNIKPSTSTGNNKQLHQQQKPSKKTAKVPLNSIKNNNLSKDNSFNNNNNNNNGSFFFHDAHEYNDLDMEALNAMDNNPLTAYQSGQLVFEIVAEDGSRWCRRT